MKAPCLHRTTVTVPCGHGGQVDVCARCGRALNSVRETGTLAGQYVEGTGR